MRCWGIASLLLGVGSAYAQPVGGVTTKVPTEEAEPAPQPLGYGAMPGGLRAPSAMMLPSGTFSVSVLGGYGARSSLLSTDHKLTRSIGDLAFAFAPIEMLTIALSFDGRYDKHTGRVPESDDGYVGDPHLLIRFSKAFGKVRAGAQLGIWVPGKDAPSVAAGATSVDARGLVSIKAGPGTASLSLGFRLDNSDESVDDPTLLSAEDQVSLGVSEFHAAVASAHFTLPVAGKGFVGMEASTDVFVGSGAPGPILRLGANGGAHFGKFSVFGFVQLAKVPGIDAADVMANSLNLIPYEPTFTAGVGFAARFGRTKHVAPPPGDVVPNPPRLIEVIEYADLSGMVLDETGKPVAGAKVTVKLKNNTGNTATDDKGQYTVSKIPIGKTIDGKTTLDDTGAEITVEVEGKKPKTTTLILVKGGNAVTAITLDPVLPPAQLKAVVRAAGTGKALAGAIVKVEPGGFTATSDADGNISLDLQPGTYTVTASMAGYKEQTLPLVIEKDGVVVKNFELRR